MECTVTVLDTSGIQPFIFGTNELRENVGASELVYRATRQWAFEALNEVLPKRHNIDLAKVEKDKTDVFNPSFRSEDGQDDAAEVVYAGGGNTVVLFRGPGRDENAKTFVYKLSRRLLRDAPGLNLYAAHSPYTWAGNIPLPKVVADTLENLARAKGGLPPALPLLGLGVTAACTSTGLPANGPHRSKGKHGRASSPANRQVYAKWKAAQWAEERLHGKFPEVAAAGFEWTYELDDMAALPNRGESYIAVVHADGNGMGRRIKQLNEEHAGAKNPRAYITAMRALSIRLQETALAALRETVSGLLRYLLTPEGADCYATKTDVDTNRPEHYFPLRPIVFGGDDVTWVSAGPWGVALAREYLAALERRSLSENDPNDRPYACAGIAVVKTHYPFSQAYNLSVELAKSAKDWVRDELTDDKDKRASALDWHFTTTGLTGSLADIRRREYTARAGRLNARPLALRSDRTWRNWATFRWLYVDAFGQDWEEKRNKIMALREALRGGPVAVEQFNHIYIKPDDPKKLPLIGVDEAHHLKDGWVFPDGKRADGICLYFDAIEALGHFFLPELDVQEATA